MGKPKLGFKLFYRKKKNEFIRYWSKNPLSQKWESLSTLMLTCLGIYFAFVQVQLQRKQDSTTTSIDTMTKMLYALRRENILMQHQNDQLDTQNTAIKRLLEETLSQGNVIFDQVSSSNQLNKNKFNKSIIEVTLQIDRLIDRLTTIHKTSIQFRDSVNFYSTKATLDGFIDLLGNTSLSLNPIILNNSNNYFTINNLENQLLDFHDCYFSESGRSSRDFFLFTQSPLVKRNYMIEQLANSCRKFIKAFCNPLLNNFYILNSKISTLLETQTDADLPVSNALKADCPTIAISDNLKADSNGCYTLTNISLDAENDIMIIMYYHNYSINTAKNIRVKLKVDSNSLLAKFTGTIFMDFGDTLAGTVVVNCLRPFNFSFKEAALYTNQIRGGTIVPNGLDIFTPSGFLLYDVPGFGDCPIFKNSAGQYTRTATCHEVWLVITMRANLS